MQGWYRKSQGLDKKIKNDGILDIGGKKRCGSIRYVRKFHFKMYKSNYKIISSTIFDFVIFVCQLHIMLGWDQMFFCTKLVISLFSGLVKNIVKRKCHLNYKIHREANHTIACPSSNSKQVIKFTGKPIIRLHALQAIENKNLACSLQHL